MGALETSRLRFRRLSGDDAGFIFELYNTRSFKRYIGDKNFRVIDDARRFIADSVTGMYRTSGLGLHLVERKSDSCPIGICGLIKRDSLDEVDLGFGYLPVYEGRGYGYEAARSFIDLARGELDLPRIVAITTSDNTPSIKLLARLGFEFDSIHEVLSETVALRLYVLNL